MLNRILRYFLYIFSYRNSVMLVSKRTITTTGKELGLNELGINVGKVYRNLNYGIIIIALYR